jgi:hypothetical protein
MPELPETQKAALRYPAKVPMMYTNVLVRRWTSFAKLGVQRITSPCMLHTGCSLDAASTVTIANADAGAAAFTNQAIDEAHRAVKELFVKNGLA